MPQPPTSDSATPPATGDPNADTDTDTDTAEPPSPSGLDASADAPEATAGPLPPSVSRAACDTVAGVELSFTLDTLDTQPPAAGWIEPRLNQALLLSGVTTGSLSVTLIDDPTMIQLHAEHCDDPTPTDVLTFDLADRSPPRPGDAVTHIDGDLVICRDEAQRQAAARGHDARTELLLYAVHGLMHLLGEDDHHDADYQRMHQREDQLFTQMGLGPVFHRAETSPRGNNDSGGGDA